MPYGIQSQLPSLLLLLLPTTCHPRAWPSYCQLPLLVTPSPQSHFTLDKTPTHPWRPQIPSLTSPPLPVLPVTPVLALPPPPQGRQSTTWEDKVHNKRRRPCALCRVTAPHFKPTAATCKYRPRVVDSSFPYKTRDLKLNCFPSQQQFLWHTCLASMWA